jgi:hypothetical protein
VRYRLGRSHLDLVYRQLGDAPSDEDPRVAVFSEVSVAIAVVQLLNGEVEEPLLVRCRFNREPHRVDDDCQDIYEAPAVAPADDPAPVPPPVAALLTVIKDWCANGGASWRFPEVEAVAHHVWAAGVEEGRRQHAAERMTLPYERGVYNAGVADGRRQATEERTEELRARVLTEAYWKLRDHAEGLRDTNFYRRSAERLHERGGQADERYRALVTRIRGIEDGARDLAEMLGVEEHEIERPGAVDHG